MQPTYWRAPKLFERAPLFLKDTARLPGNRLIAICSYLFLSVPIFQGVINNQPTKIVASSATAPNAASPCKCAPPNAVLPRRVCAPTHVRPRMPRRVLRPIPFAEAEAVPPPPLSIYSTTTTTCSSSSSSLSTPSMRPSPAPPPSPTCAQRRALALLAQLELRNAELHRRSAAALLEARRDAAFRALVALAALSMPPDRARSRSPCVQSARGEARARPIRRRRSRSAPPAPG